MKRLLAVTLALGLASSALAWPFGPKGDSNTGKKANIRQQRDEMLAQLYAANPGMEKVIRQAAGYATFKQVNVNLLLLAAANGYGVVVDNQAHQETCMRMGSLGGGIGAGVKDVRVIFVFHDAKVMKQFIEEGWQFGGQADAAAKYQDTGVAAELAARASCLNLDDGPNHGGRMVVLMPGLNWYWSRYVRPQAGYGWAIAQDGPHPGNLNIFQARRQLSF